MIRRRLPVGIGVHPFRVHIGEIFQQCIENVGRFIGAAGNKPAEERDVARVDVNLNAVEQTIETVLHKANSAPLEARYDARDARVLISKVVK